MNRHDEHMSYADAYRDTDFRAHPEAYRIGRGEQGVLMAEPYKSEILPYWKFKTPADAEESAQKIYQLFLDYKKADDFVGMDMARKFLQMGFTRSRRYANHPSGRKYQEGRITPQAESAMTSEKARSAEIFYDYYQKAKDDKEYLEHKERHRQDHERSAKQSK